MDARRKTARNSPTKRRLRSPRPNAPGPSMATAQHFSSPCEAKRIDLAFLFDPMMAVHTSNVEPLPHQITAVYESMLPRQPLRFVLADDPGAGKTIMAGLYIRELIMRADARRILIVAPGSLVEQWRDELFEKFGLEFRIFTSALEEASPSGNPFEDHHQLIVRLDQMARNEELQDKLCAAGWDLVVFDEAHKLAAHFFGTKLEKTGRFRFAEKLGQRHPPPPADDSHAAQRQGRGLPAFPLAARFRPLLRQVPRRRPQGRCSDLMRRMVKEELVKFDGTPLFPERKAYTVNYKLSDIEAALYEAVTEYVKTEMGKADQLEGLAQRLGRLRAHRASAPSCLQPGGHLPVTQTPQGTARTPPARREARHPRPASRWPKRSPTSPRMTTTSTPRNRKTSKKRSSIRPPPPRPSPSWKHEIVILPGLEQQAKAVVASGQDRKWDELSKILQNDPEMRDAVRPPAQDHHLFRAPRHAELPAPQSPGCSATATPSSPSTAARIATSAAASRRCSAPTPTSACWSPRTPPAKA